MYKTLTICQPYAELIMRGQKLVENRTWKTGYRGPLLIHAGKSKEWMRDYRNWPKPEDLVFGAILGVVDLVACHQYEDINEGSCPDEYVFLREHIHTEGPWCWVLASPKRLVEPIPFRGQQGLYGVPDRVMDGALYHCGSCQ